MDIIETYSTTKDGNDCLISKDIALAIINDEHVVIESTKYSGWQGKDINTTIHCNDYSYIEAKDLYNKLIKDI